jgi:hypothetical protein
MDFSERRMERQRERVTRHFASSPILITLDSLSEPGVGTTVGTRREKVEKNQMSLWEASEPDVHSTRLDRLHQSVTLCLLSHPLC